MSSFELPTWYPLRAYSCDMNEQEWAAEIFVRSIVRQKFEQAPGEQTLLDWASPDLSTALDFFNFYVVHDETIVDALFPEDDRKRKKYWPVSEMTEFEVEFLAELARSKSHPDVRRWAKRLAQDSSKWWKRYFGAGVHKRIEAKSRGFASDRGDSDASAYTHADVLGHRLPLMIDINMDDETLKFFFAFWLKIVRETSGQSKRPFKAEDFAAWKKYGLLQAFDLSMWGELTGENYTDVFIAQTIWPDTNVSLDGADRTESYRKTTKKHMRNLIDGWESQRLLNQATMSHVLKKLLDKASKERAEKVAEP